MKQVKPMSASSDRTRIIFIAILTVYCIYSGLYIAQTSFDIDGERYFVLLDDAMVTMRYAVNLADGHGPVYNPEQSPVEGYTNPLWMLYMALLHLLPIAKAKISLLIQITGALLGLATLVILRRLANTISNNDSYISLGAVMLTAFYLPLNTWNLQGMEVSLASLIVLVAALATIHISRRGGSLVSLYILLGLSTLVRMDMIIPAGVLVFTHMILLPERRREIILLSVVTIGGFLLLQTSFRYFYYGDLLPNTYYLKMTGYSPLLRIERGLAVLWGFVSHMYVIPFLLPFLFLRWRRDRELLLLLGLFSAQVVYSVYVGGDVWEWWGGSNRFISIAMPLFFVAYSVALSRLSIRSTMRKTSHKKQPSDKRARVVIICLLAISLPIFNMIHGPASLADWALVEQPLHIEDNRNMIRRAKLVEQFTTPEASIAVTWAGSLPYFCGRPTIDLLGKTDQYIAHGKAAQYHPRRPYGEFLPGHMKWDYAHSLGQLKPDMIIQFWGPANAAAKWWQTDYHVAHVGQFVFCFRKEATTIYWDRVPGLALPDSLKDPQQESTL